MKENKRKLDLKRFIVIVLAFGLVLGFSDTILSVYEKIVVNPILSNYNSHWFSELSIIIVCLTFLIKGITKVHKAYNGLLNNYILFGGSFFVVIYWLVRFSTTKYNFYEFANIKGLYVSDLFFISLSIVILYSLFAWIFLFITKNHKQPEIRTDLIDEMHREPFAKSIADYIKSHENLNGSYAIGITGKWGEGKSVFMNFIHKYLSNDKENNSIVISFNPWYSSSPKALVFDFFATLQKELKAYNPNIDSVFKSYALQLIRYYDKNNALETLFDTLTNNPKTLQDKFEDVRKAIEKIGKQIVICIDDLDRLDKEEIIEVIRLIRNTANFNNTVFVVTYDKEYIVSALKDINDYGCDKYLEKIFQHEVVLPAHESFLLKNKLKEFLKFQTSNDHSKWLDEVFAKNYSFPDITLFFKNYRDVQRFSNSFCLPFLQVKGDVNETQFFYLMLLNFKYPSIYNLIRDNLYNLNWNTCEYFRIITGNATINETIALEREENLNNGQTQGQYKIIKYLNDKKYNSNDVELIIKVLEVLFPFSNMPTLFSNLIIDGYNHIHLTTNIKKYFSFRIQEHNISSLELVEAFAQPLNVLKEKIGEWITNKKNATLELYFKSLNVYSSKQFYEKSLTALFFFANQFNPEKPDDVISTNAYVARERLLFKNTGKLYKNEKDHKKVIIKLFEQSPIPALFSARLLAEEIKEGTIYDNNLGKFPLEKEEIIEINVGFLKQYLDQSEKFTVQAFWLYHSCDNALKKKNKDAGKLIIDYANEKDIIGFILFMIHNTTDGGNFIRLSPLILSLFDSYENFTEFLKNVNNDTPEFKEFMVFYNKLVKRNFESFDYKFKYLKLNRFMA